MIRSFEELKVVQFVEREKMNLTAPSPVLAEPAVLCNPDGSDNLIGLPCSASIMGNLFLMAVYGGLLAYGAERISTGSEKLLEVRGPFPNNEIVGSFLRLFVCVLSPSGPLSPSISVYLRVFLPGVLPHCWPATLPRCRPATPALPTYLPLLLAFFSSGSSS